MELDLTGCIRREGARAAKSSFSLSGDLLYEARSRFLDRGLRITFGASL
jgi:hypothetical protein